MAIDFDKIQESPHLLDILVQMEDVLDSFDIYVFKNWINGEIVDGPKLRRYWFDFTLRYEYDSMPDPKGAMRLIKHGVRIDYSKVVIKDSDLSDDTETNIKNDDKEKDKPTHWEISISIPRKLLNDMNSAELDFYEDEVDIEDVSDAIDHGMTDETGYHDDDMGSDEGRM